LLASEFGKPLIVQALLQHDDIKTSMKYIHDVDDLVMSDEYSPLRLLDERYKKAHGSDEQPLLLGDGEASSESTALVPVSGEVVVEPGMEDLVGDMFPKVGEGVKVRPLLKYEDLLLMREVFVWYASHNRSSNNGVRARELMRRMLRKS